MKNINVKKLWQGTVGIHEKYRGLTEDLKITNLETGESMTIPAGDGRLRVARVGKEYFRDHYNKDIYRLIYIKWKADKKEVVQTLF